MRVRSNESPRREAAEYKRRTIIEVPSMSPVSRKMNRVMMHRRVSRNSRKMISTRAKGAVPVGARLTTRGSGKPNREDRPDLRLTLDGNRPTH